MYADDSDKLRKAIDGAPAAEDWPDPQPLPARSLSPVCAFEPELLPAVFAPWVKDIAERMQCPPDFPAVGAMVAAASLIGRRAVIRPKRQDDWTVVPNVWGALVGTPGVMKSPPLDDVLRPLRAMEIEAGRQYADAVKRATLKATVGKIAAEESAKAARKAYRAGGSTAAMDALQADEAPNEAPIRRRFIVNDATIEALGDVLKTNPYGVLLFRDELSGFLRQMDRQGHEGDRAFYLEAWNGNGRFTYDRILRGTIDIEACCVSILGTIQPGPLGDYLAAAAHGGAGDDGFVARFQLIVWPDVSPDWRNVDRWPSRDAKGGAQAAFERLASLDAGAVGAEQCQHGGLPFLRFDAAAQAVFDEWRAALEARLRSGDLPPMIEAHLAKYRSLAPSLALICHLADGGAGPVPEREMLRAAAWCEYLESHAHRIYGHCGARRRSPVERLAERVLAGDLPEPFTRTDVRRHCGGSLAVSADAQAAIDKLIELGWLRGEERRPSKGAGRPTVVYWVNPKVEALP